MQILLDLIKGLIAIIAAAALSPFGVELHAPRSVEREVERVQICKPEQGTGITVKSPTDC
jgi:hypothetical protein